LQGHVVKYKGCANGAIAWVVWYGDEICKVVALHDGRH